ncbi:MAG: AI-2E family transporter [Dehalococcoidia bacterium]
MFSLTRRRLRAAMAAGASLFLLWLLYSARSSLTPFYVAITFAFLFAPLVDRLERLCPFRQGHPNLASALAILVLYFAFGAVLIGFAVVVVPRAVDQGASFASDTPRLIERAQRELTSDKGSYRRRVPPEMQRRIAEQGNQLAGRAGDIAQVVVTRVLALFVGSVSLITAYIVVPFWLFFVLKDRRQNSQSFYNLFPAEIRDDVRHIVRRSNAVLGSYLQAQVYLATFTGVVTALGLMLLGIRFGIILGLIAGIANLIPVVGSMLGGIPVLVVALATHPGWTVLWVFLFLFVAQELKDFILVPHVQAGAVNLHPAVILVLLVISGHLAGFWGLFIAVPVAAVARDTFVYVYTRLGDTEPSCGSAAGQEAYPERITGRLQLPEESMARRDGGPDLLRATPQIQQRTRYDLLSRIVAHWHRGNTPG